MRNIAVIDEAFDGHISPECHLSVQYGDRSFSFAILDTASMKYLAFKHYWFENPIPRESQAEHLRNLLQVESYLSAAYNEVYFMYMTPVSVLIPAPLFRKEDPEAYFRFSSRIKPADRILFRKIPSIDAFVLFPVPDELITQASGVLQNVRFFHQACPQVEEAIAESAGQTGASRVVAHVSPGFADLMVIRSGQLVLYNSFIIKNANDLVFFILYLYEQFSLSQEETPLTLSGLIELYPGTVELLDQYLKQTAIRKFPANYVYSDSFRELTQHHHSPLINLARCG
jgi:hypothetical protein